MNRVILALSSLVILGGCAMPQGQGHLVSVPGGVQVCYDNGVCGPVRPVVVEAVQVVPGFPYSAVPVAPTYSTMPMCCYYAPPVTSFFFSYSSGGHHHGRRW